MRRAFLSVLGTMLAVASLGAHPASAASQPVTIRDNKFDPQETRIQPGDTVVWSNQGARVHDVTSDRRGEFRSQRMRPGGSFSKTFDQPGYYYYYCSVHGARGKVGMWGLVVVGDPPPEADPYLNSKGGRDKRPTIVVPKDVPTIQKAVDRAKEGARILVRPGTYKTSVNVKTDDLIIEGVDRFRTILHGEDKRSNGIVVDGASGVTVRDLTVRNYTGNGIYYNNARNYTIAKVDAIK